MSSRTFRRNSALAQASIGLSIFVGLSCKDISLKCTVHHIFFYWYIGLLYLQNFRFHKKKFMWFQQLLGCLSIKKFLWSLNYCQEVNIYFGYIYLLSSVIQCITCRSNSLCEHLTYKGRLASYTKKLCIYCISALQLWNSYISELQWDRRKP